MAYTFAGKHSNIQNRTHIVKFSIQIILFFNNIYTFLFFTVEVNFIASQVVVVLLSLVGTSFAETGF
jgi:hypothetical protein